MLKYICVRLAAMPVLLFSVLTVTFVIGRAILANALATVLSSRALANPGAVAAAKKHWGLDGSLLSQYGRYLDNLLHGNVGTIQRLSTTRSDRDSRRLRCRPHDGSNYTIPAAPRSASAAGGRVSYISLGE